MYCTSEKNPISADFTVLDPTESSLCTQFAKGWSTQTRTPQDSQGAGGASNGPTTAWPSRPVCWCEAPSNSERLGEHSHSVDSQVLRAVEDYWEDQKCVAGLRIDAAARSFEGRLVHVVDGVGVDG